MSGPLFLTTLHNVCFQKREKTWHKVQDVSTMMGTQRMSLVEEVH